MKTFFLSVLSILFCVQISGQVEFYNGTTQILGEEKVYSTICIGLEDLNGDLLDDLFLLDDGTTLKTFIQGAPKQPYTYKEHLRVSTFGDWSFISGDLDNDGVPEIICSGYEDGSQILKFDGETYLTMQKAGDVYSQNSNLVDLNADGYLDFFICNDDGENLTFLNDGSGGMTVESLIDFQTTAEDDMSGNYSSIFTDIDGDNDLDLYIGKCRAGVIDATDPRRINTLYINNGDGSYTENGEAFGLNIGAQSWSVDAGDVDNDGDIDIIIANHDRPHDLMINDGNGHFDRKTLVPDGYSSFAYQSFFCDFDNNGWLDIFITDPSATFILFNDEMSFSRRDIINSGRKAFSGATGDLNSDGFPDLYLGFGNSFQNASTTADKIFLNETNTNNYLDVSLVGTVSNRDAIGAKVIIYQGERSQTREILAGKSYGIMNSTMVHFGLGRTSEIDSLKVKWPSGLETLVEEVNDVNTILSIKEDGCVTSMLHMPDLHLCGGNQISASVPSGYDKYTWSNGTTESYIIIDEYGWYRAILEKDGCITYTSYFEVTEEVELTQNEILTDINIVACKGDVIKLTSYPGTYYLWSNGEQTQTIEVIESGVYDVFMNTNCFIYQSNSVEVLFADTIEASIENDTILVGQTATFMGESENLNWYQNKNDIVPLASGIEFTTPPLDESQTYYVGDATSGSVYDKFLMTSVPLNNVGDSIYTENDMVQFEVLEDLTLNSVKVRTQKAGTREVVIMKENILMNIIIDDLHVGTNTINIDLQLDAGVYTISTKTSVNQANFGSDHPQLSYSTIYTAEDKRINGYIEIADSDLYPGVTPYFFNWDIDYGSYNCEPRVPVHAVIKDLVSTDDLTTYSTVYPNPTSGLVTIQTDIDLPYSIDIFDVSGSKVQETILGESQILTIDMPINSGLYFVKLTNGALSEVKKIYVY